MGITSSIKGSFLKSTLETLTHGNSGSNILGAVAVALLGSGLDFSLLVQGFKDEKSSIECGKAAALGVMAVWAYFIGRPKKENLNATN